MYNSDRLRGKIEPFVDRLKQTYGNPQATEGPQLAVTDDVYAEKKTHWSDSQTHVTLIERTGHEDDVPQEGKRHAFSPFRVTGPLLAARRGSSSLAAFATAFLSKTSPRG